MWQLFTGGLTGYLYYEYLMKQERKELKEEQIQNLTDEQIKRILLNPKIKNIIEDIIKKQTGIINAFDPEGYYRDKEIKNNCKSYTLKIEDE